MKIKYLAHASFMVTSVGGTRIITDPYAVGGRIRYGAINEAADIVTISHDHSDHNDAACIRGNPAVVRETGLTAIRGIRISGISSFHDDSGGSERGGNVIFRFEVDGMIVCHLGDLGHVLSHTQIAEIGSVDVLLLPVGGYRGIDARAATEVCGQLRPKVVIPMHYLTEHGPTHLSGVEEFLRGKADVRRLDACEVEFAATALPVSTQIVVLQSAL